MRTSCTQPRWATFMRERERGIFKSTDGGANWSKVLFVDDATGAIDLVMDNAHPNTLYAAMWQAYRRAWRSTRRSRQRSLQDDRRRRALDEDLHESRLPDRRARRMGVSVAQSDPKVVYAIVQAKEGGVFRSDDGGAHWKRVNDSMEMRQRAFYYMAIYADPTDPNTIYVPKRASLFRTTAARTSVCCVRRTATTTSSGSIRKSEDHPRGQRRRRDRFGRSRRNVEQRAQSAHRATLSRRARRGVSVQRLRRAARRRLVRRTERVIERRRFSQPIGSARRWARARSSRRSRATRTSTTAAAISAS